MENRKLVSLKSLLLRSWRERWLDTYWSIQAKQLLKFDSESEQILLADLLLQQGLAGSTPNLLVISYFKHAVNARMINWHIGFESILKFEDSTRVYCLKSLVEIVESLLPRICINGTQEDSWVLGTTSLKLVNWLLLVGVGCLEKIAEDCQSAEYATVVGKSCGVLEAMTAQPALMALLRVAQMENPDLGQRMCEYEAKAKVLLKSLESLHIQMDAKTVMERGLNISSKIATRQRSMNLILDPSHQPINASVNVLLHIDAVLNLTGDIQPFIHQLCVLKSTQGITFPSLICDMLRTCFVEMVEVLGSPDELKWSAYTFVKMPQILVHLCRLPGAELAHVVQGLEKLLNYQPLLDLVDIKYSSECMDLLCTELCSSTISLLSQSQMQLLLERRKKESKKQTKLDQVTSQQSCAPSPSRILRAAPTVQSMLTALETDYSKNFEDLIGVMGKMMGKTLDLLLTAAAATTGKVQAFASELIKFSEMAKQSTGEAGKGAQTRAHLFDMLFLMLCHIAQTYGLEICHSNKPALEKCFFIKWAQMWLPEEGQYKPVDCHLVQDDQRVDGLLTQIQPGGELKTSLTRWNEAMYNIRYVIQDIVNAWEYEALSQDQVKSILMSLRSKMGSLCIGAAAFLCSYISQVERQRQQKPLQMMEMLLQSQPQYEANAPFYMQERAQLLQMVLSKLAQQVLPANSSHSTPPPYSLPIKEPLKNVLDETWSQVFRSGTVTTLQLQRLESILSVGGCQWFSSMLIKRLLLEERVEDLHKGACLLLSLFSLDMHKITICLLHHTLPMLFQNCRNQLLTGPRAVVLAKLCASCLLMLQPSVAPSGADEEVMVRKSRKRTRTEIELEDSDLDLNVIRSSGRTKLMCYPRPSKIRKSESSGALPTAHLDDQDAVIIEPDEMPNSVSMEPRMEPLDIATAGLMRTFDGVIQGNRIGEKTQFIHAFLKEVVRAGDQLSHYIVQFMPNNMVLQLLKLMPGQFDLDVLLAVCDLSSTQCRKLASKVICHYEQLHRKNSVAIANKG